MLLRQQNQGALTSPRVRVVNDDAMRWLREVHAGKVRPVGMVGTATDTDPSPRRRSHLVVQADRWWGR